MKTPSLTLVLPFFNGEQYLSPLLSTLLPQAESLREIIAVDDASTDSSVEIIRSFQRDLPIELLRLPGHSGPAEARNAPQASDSAGATGKRTASAPSKADAGDSTRTVRTSERRRKRSAAGRSGPMGGSAGAGFGFGASMRLATERDEMRSTCRRGARPAGFEARRARICRSRRPAETKAAPIQTHISQD